MANENRIEERLARIELSLYGDGNGNPGLRMQVDRLVQSEQRRSKHIWALWGAVSAGAAAAIATVAAMLLW